MCIEKHTNCEFGILLKYLLCIVDHCPVFYCIRYGAVGVTAVVNEFSIRAKNQRVGVN